jgi:hypothetical protein
MLFAPQAFKQAIDKLLLDLQSKKTIEELPGQAAYIKTKMIKYPGFYNLFF